MYTIIPTLQRNKKEQTPKLYAHMHAHVRPHTHTHTHTHTHQDTVHFCELRGNLIFTPEPPA